jgi:alpha-L-rhamnosidase
MYTPAFFNHFIKSLRAEQQDQKGMTPIFVPTLKARRGLHFLHMQGSSVWGDVSTILPWSLWTMYGDKSLLRKHYPLMKDWVDWIIEQDVRDGDRALWHSGRHYGDWLALDTDTPETPTGGTDSFYVASAFYWNSTNILAKAAGVLGLEDDEQLYRARAERIRQSFIAAYFNQDGSLKIRETQTALVIALAFELYPDGLAAKLLQSLVNRIRGRDNHLDTGFVGTYLLVVTLSKYSADETAYSLLLQDTFPSWLYPVTMGSTTIWERWNAVLPDGTLFQDEMNSLNHYAYGSIANWMYRCMGGLNPIEEFPGYKKARIAPKTDPRVTKVRVIRDTAAGRYEIEWEFRPSFLHFRVVVPFDCEALVVLPEKKKFWSTRENTFGTAHLVHPIEEHSENSE